VYRLQVPPLASLTGRAPGRSGNSRDGICAHQQYGTDSKGGRNAAVVHDDSAAVNISAGVRQPRVLRGGLLSRSSTARRSYAVRADRSLPLRKHWRSRPLMFSFVPRCHSTSGGHSRRHPELSGA
jgi:hypothetical protein